MATANNPQIDTVDAAEKALVKAKQELAAAEKDRAAAVVEAQTSFTTAIAVLSSMRGIAGSAMLDQCTDNVANAEQNIATVTAQCDEQVERAKKAVKAAGAALHWVVQATLKGIQDTADNQKIIARIKVIATKAGQKNEMDELKRKHDAEVATLAHNHATMLATEEENARQHAAAIETQRTKLAEQLKQLELD